MGLARNGNEDDDDEEEDESGPEAVDGADGKRALPPARSPLPGAAAANPFSEDLELELQRQQTSEFDPENEPRHETPTPPADEVPGGLGLVSDNVAESGEESEDEWNYYRVDPKGESEEGAEKEQQTKPEVCKEQPQKGEKEEEEGDNMESQLNPNAAEFIPSPTHNMPSMEEILSKAQTVEESFNNTFSSVNTADMLEIQERELDKQELTSREELVNLLNVDANVKVEDCDKEPNSAIDESTTFSTKAEFGDESISSGADFQKILDTSSNIMESSLMGQDFLSTDEQESSNVLEDATEPSVVEKEPISPQDLTSDIQKEPVHISFELQKEIAPQMEADPERVKVDSDDQSPTLDSEPEFNNVNSVTENDFVDNLEFSHEIAVNNIPLLEDVASVSKPTSQDVDILGNMGDGIPTNIEKKNAVDFLGDDVDFLAGVGSKQHPTDSLLEFMQTVEKTEFVESVDTSEFLQKDFKSQEEAQREIPSQHSESSLSELTDELPVQQETINQLSKEISTPEYEKLEKDLEASEQLEDKYNSAKENIPVDFSSVVESDILNTSDVLLESAHPDKVALLDDACSESLPSSIAAMGNVGEFSNGLLNAPTSDLFDTVESEQVPQDSDILDHLIHIDTIQITENVPEVGIPVASFETAPLDTVSPQNSQLDMPTTETVPQDNTFIEQSDIVPKEHHVHIPTHEVMQPELVSNELSESTQAPPPTPLITDLAEKEHLSFGNGTENFIEVVEKLSVTQSESRVEEEKIVASQMSNDVVLSPQIIEDSESLPPAPASVLEPPEKTEASEPVHDVIDTEPTVSDVAENTVPAPTIVAAGGVLAATVASAAAAAVSTIDNKDSKKEKDTSTKKPAAVPMKDKKPLPEKPKSATKSAVSSRLAATATKPKSPTSPIKAPVTQKTAPTKPPITATSNTSKPLSKPSTTKTTSRPLSSTAPRPATTLASKPKPATSLAASKSTVPAVGLAKTRPTPSPSEKKTVTNGDIKTSKRPEQLSTKTMPSTTAKTTLRPATAPATRTVSKTLSSVSSTVAKTKSSLNGPTKPKTSPPVSSIKSVAKASNEKEIKETANKQISTRTTTSTVRSTTTTTASKSSVMSASRKIESRVVTNGKGPAMKPSGMIKTTTTTMSSRMPSKKPATTTRVKATKTESIVEKSETVQGSKTVIALSE